jgi:hypothetical protein
MTWPHSPYELHFDCVSGYEVSLFAWMALYLYRYKIIKRQAFDFTIVLNSLCSLVPALSHTLKEKVEYKRACPAKKNWRPIFSCDK